jgi:hypothetical protein
MDLYIVLLIAGAVWAVVVVGALALCKAAGRAEAEADQAYRAAAARKREPSRTGEVARRPDRWHPAAL